MEDGWHQRIGERALKLWVAEGRPAGREQAHWLRAEDELWQEALGTTRTLADYLNRMGRSLDDGTEDSLRAAAETGCRAMRFLIEETEFPAQLRAMSGRPPPTVWSHEANAYVTDIELFHDFLAVERRILLRSGLDPVLTQQIIGFLARNIDRLKAGEPGVSPQSLLDVAVFRACEAWETIKNRPPALPDAPTGFFARVRRSARGVWIALGGGAVYVANVAAAAALIPVLGEVSKMAGNFMFGHGMRRTLDRSH
jgi:hypothetical protein